MGAAGDAGHIDAGGHEVGGDRAADGAEAVDDHTHENRR
jgi:hypothetical protein